MTTILAFLAGILAVPALVIAAILLDLAVNYSGTRSVSSCQWCDWSMRERRWRPSWLVAVTFRVHRDRNHRAEVRSWKARQS